MCKRKKYICKVIYRYILLRYYSENKSLFFKKVYFYYTILSLMTQRHISINLESCLVSLLSEKGVYSVCHFCKYSYRYNNRDG